MTPCGGIYPIKNSSIMQLISFGECFVCGLETNVNDLWCEEFDTQLHRECLEDFLKMEEGRIVIEHGHDIIRF